MNIWILRSEFEKLICEVQIAAPYETGGVLAGYCSEDNTEVVVTNILGPGQNARHHRFSYHPDYKSDRDRMGVLYDDNEGRIRYLGDWHSHPGGKVALSWIDKRALRNMAKFKGNFMDSPIMIILGGDVQFLECGGWRVFRDSKKGFFPKWDYVTHEISYYDEP